MHNNDKSMSVIFKNIGRPKIIRLNLLSAWFYSSIYIYRLIIIIFIISEIFFLNKIELLLLLLIKRTRLEFLPYRGYHLTQSLCLCMVGLKIETTAHILNLESLCVTYILENNYNSRIRFRAQRPPFQHLA
jgi:hypothetical protein